MKNKSSILKDQCPMIPLWILTVFVIVESIYVFLAGWGAVRLMSQRTMPQGFWAAEYWNELRFEHDLFLYSLTLTSVIATYLISKLIFKSWSRLAAFDQRVRFFIFLEAVLVLMIIQAAYKAIIYDYRPQVAQMFFYGLLICSLVHKIFARQIFDWISALGRMLTDPVNSVFFRKLTDIICLAVVFVVIFIPYPEAMLARMYVGEQCHHFNHAVMGPAWAYLKGAVLNVDVISPYGLGLPVVLAYLSMLFGGFSYEHVVMGMIALYVFYFMGWYGLLRVWWKNSLLALAAVLWAIKTQMFHPGVYPIVYTYPSATIIRYVFDVLFLFLIWRHLVYSDQKYLRAAGCVCGFAIFYLTDTGVYMAAAYYGYLVLMMLEPAWRRKIIRSKQDWMSLGLLFILPLISLFVFLTIFNGNNWLSSNFWGNLREFIQYFISGFGLTPMTESLMYRNFGASFVGFLIPAVYVMTLVVTVSLCFFKKWDRPYLFVAVLCIYGLGIYHYYVARSAVTSYYAVGVPYAVIVFFWIKIILESLSLVWQKRLTWMIVGSVGYALLTTHSFTAYPNLLNLSRNPMTDTMVNQPLPNNRQTYFHHLWHDYPAELRLSKNFIGETNERLVTDQNFRSDDQLVQYYRRDFSFKKDSALIRELTGPEDKVALLSSFDVKMLMEADRRPLFYYFPIANERPMYMRTFFVERFYTVNELNRILNQLKKENPRHIFMEKILLTEDYPQAYEFHLYGIVHLLRYVRENYTSGPEGEFLVAMTRKGN